MGAILPMPHPGSKVKSKEPIKSLKPLEGLDFFEDLKNL
jgi:hypothetical protein